MCRMFCLSCLTYPYTISHTITATLHQQIPLSLATNTKMHTNYTLQSKIKIELGHNFTNLAEIAKKYTFLYKPHGVDSREIYPSQHLLVFNVWMIHKIEIFPHYTYPLPDGAAKLKAKTNNLERTPEAIEREDELENAEQNKFAADEVLHCNHTNSTAHTPSLSSSPPTHTNLVQPYRTCSHYGFNYPITYQPHITIHPAHLLTAVQLQREKVIAFIKSTALSLNNGYLQQQRELYSIRQPRAPRLKSCEPLRLNGNASKKATVQHTTTHSDSINNNDSNGSYISVKEIKLEPTKRRRRVSKVSSERGCDNESVVQQLSEHDRDMHTPHLTHAHSFSEQFSSLLSIGGTSYPAGSHSHTADLAHYHDEEEEDHHVDDGVHQQHYDDDSADNYSAVFARTITPTTQRATYLLRDFVPAHAQTHEMPEHKPESEQELHLADIKLSTSTPKVRKLLNSCDDEEPDDTHLYAHHSHKQIKLTLNPNVQSAALKRHSAHAAQETAATATAAALGVGLPHERYRHVTASLSEAGSSSVASSLRSLEIHININVKNSDCARTLQTHETEFRRKLERIINEEINVIAQQLCGCSQQHPTDSNNLCSGMHIEPNDSSPLGMSHASARHLLQHTAHLKSLSDLRSVGTLAAGQPRMRIRSKAAKLAHAQTQSQSTKHKHSTTSLNSTDSTCCVGGAATKTDQTLSPQQREVIAMLEQELESLLNGIICANALHNHAVMCDCKMKVAQISKELRTSLNAGENVQNGDHSEAHLSTFSQSSKEDVSTDGSPKKDKKKKKGLRTPSFLKKKKEKKKAEA